MAAAGLGPQVEHGGTVYQFSVLDGIGYALYQAWLERQAVRAVRAQRDYLPDAEYRVERAEVNRDIAAQVYAFGSERFTQSLRSLPGLKEVCRLALQKRHPGADDELVDALFRADQAGMIRVGLAVLGASVPDADGGGA